MVRVSYDQKPARRTIMELYGASVRPSPSEATALGDVFWLSTPVIRARWGVAISEAIEDASGIRGPSIRSASVLNHVLLHQTVIGQEAVRQLPRPWVVPDIVIGCHGGARTLPESHSRSCATSSMASRCASSC